MAAMGPTPQKDLKPGAPMPKSPPGLSPWGAMGGAAGDSSSREDWTGTYTVTLAMASAQYDHVRKAVPNEYALDPALISGGRYPILLSFGAIEDARSRQHSFLGFNYLEAFSAVPGISITNPKGQKFGPFLHPYRGYLNHLIPVILGRFSGYQKYWERVNFVRASFRATNDQFVVNHLFSNRPMIQSSFQLVDLGSYTTAGDSDRVHQFAKILAPNMIGKNLFGKLTRTSFEFDYINALAWEVTGIQVTIDTPGVIPGVTKTVQWGDIREETFKPVRLLVPWRLLSDSKLFGTTPAPLVPAKTSGSESAS